MEIAITPINGFIFRVEDIIEDPENYTEDELKEHVVEFLLNSDSEWVLDSLDWEAEIIG